MSEPSSVPERPVSQAGQRREQPSAQQKGPRGRASCQPGKFANAPVDRAAGGVVRRDGAVLVVHRPRYDDWSLPKGHLHRGETWQQAALREVAEETGVLCEIVSSAFPVAYLVNADPGVDLPKIVMFYAMSPVVVPDRLCGDPDEVDAVAWWMLPRALHELSYAVERQACAALTR